MPLASEVRTTQETLQNGSIRFRSFVRTNVNEKTFKAKLESLSLLARAEAIEHYETNWHWTGTGQGYEILWLDTTTFDDLIPLARL